MPNGGPDCCGNCGFNRAVQEMAHPHPDQRERFWELSHCQLRQVKITNPFWTYCRNFRYGKCLPAAGDPERPQGQIFASGLFEGYVRIPWHGASEPHVAVSCVCVVCGRRSARGIAVRDGTQRVGFCSNRHYVEWWEQRHQDDSVSSELFMSPEELSGRSGTEQMRSDLKILPYLDSEEMASSRQRELNIPRDRAAALGRTAVEAAERGFYETVGGGCVDWKHSVSAACLMKRSIRRDDKLPAPLGTRFRKTRVQVTNETTLGAAKRLVDQGQNPLALNFGNGVSPGGGFLTGARAQEEVLCRSSALYLTLVGDLMYQAHQERSQPDSTAWAIYSPEVPVFRHDDGTELEQPWLLDVITCAAPYAPRIGQPRSRELLRERIYRVLKIAEAYGFSALILGAWGCGAFGNDPGETALDFRTALETELSGAFEDVVFAISDWSTERRFLGPFRHVFGD